MLALSSVISEVIALCRDHIDTLQERLEENTGSRPSKDQIRRVLRTFEHADHETTFSTSQAAMQLRRSNAWVKATAREIGVGRVRRTAGRGQMEFTVGDIDLLSQSRKDTTRGRPVINKYRNIK